MADLSSEVRLARLAKEYGYEVKLGRRPDLFIDGKGIEVKRVRTRPVIHRLRKVPLASLSNPIRRGLKQKADVIAVQVNSLNKRKIKDFKIVWTATDTLKNVLERVLAFRKRRPVLLFCGTSRGYFARIVLVK